MTDQSILIFGAGKIGRSFIGQLFGNAGYEVVFVDMDESLVQELNRRGSYPVIIKGVDKEERLVIENVRAIYAVDKGAVIKAIRDTNIMAISVGKSAMPAIAPVIAKGLLERESHRAGRILDMILAENMRSSDLFFREKLRENLPPSYPLDTMVGLVETSIGKMVPIMTPGDLAEDPLQVFAEPYNTLILDKKGFKGEIPTISGLALKENMKAWVDRKAFIHNLGHATAAYSGNLKYPQATFMYEVLGDVEVYGFTKKVMHESAQILMASYPGEFTWDGLSEHIDDLLNRFQNRNLGDTVFRVGSDLQRKLGRDDRFMGMIRLGGESDLPCDLIIEAMALGFTFKGKDQHGQMFPGDVDFHREWSQDPHKVLEKVCGLTKKGDEILVNKLLQLYHQVSRHS